MSAIEESLVTAYALGELEGAELAQIELMLQRDPAVRAEVEAIQSFGCAIAAALTDEPVLGVRSDAASARGSAFVRWALPLAAVVVLGLGLSHFARRKSPSVDREPTLTSLPGERFALGQPEQHRIWDRGRGVVLARVVPVEPVVLLLPGRAIATDRLDQLLNTPPPNMDLRMKFSYQSPHPAADGPLLGEPVRSFIPDPQFDRFPAGLQGAEAKMPVVVPRADLDRGMLIWAVPAK